jgi:Transglutaminase-like superfamily
MVTAIGIVDRVEPEPMRDWIDRLRELPDRCRDFSVGARRAEREFGIDAGTMRELLAAGMPYADIDGDPRLCAADLHYVAVRLGCATAYLQAMRWWAAALTQSARWGALDVVVRCVTYAAVGTEVDLRGPSGSLRSRIAADRVAGILRFTTAGAWPSPEPSIAGLLADIAALDFRWIADSAEDPVGIARRTGLADCASAARLLVEECHARDIEARTAYGLLLSSPYSTPHNWAEIDIDGQWVPFDPLLLALLSRHAGIDGAVWPPTRSPGGVLLRLAEHPQPIATAAGEPLDATFLTALENSSQSRHELPSALPQRE